MELRALYLGVDTVDMYDGQSNKSFNLHGSVNWGENVVVGLSGSHRAGLELT